MSRTTTQERAALVIWYAARCASGQRPDTARIARVRAKLADPAALLLVEESSGRPAGMALAEPFRADDGRGQVREEFGHVSMVFVRPELQRRGFGQSLILRLQAEAWEGLSLWTREANAGARGLYAACGFRPTSEVSRLPAIGVIRRWQWDR